MSALLGTSCRCSRVATAESVRLLVGNSESVERLDSVIVAVHDTLTITKTITIRENEHGDTIRMSVVTDRERLRSMSDVRSKTSDVIVKRDTVYIARNDSLQVTAYGLGGGEKSTVSSKLSAVSKILKWVFGILVCIIILVLCFKVKRLLTYLKF